MNDNNWNELRDKIIGLGDQSGRKSYFPELQKKINDLQEREQNLVTLLDSMMDAVFIIDQKGNIMGINDSVLRLFQLGDRGIALSHHFIGYTRDIDAELLHQIIAETIGGMPQILEWPMRSPVDHATFDAELSMHATIWNHLPAIIVTVRDITFRKNIEKSLKERELALLKQNQQLQQLNAQLAESNRHIAEMNQQLRAAQKKAVESDRLKSAFLANMSHEIRTPMNGIIGFASLLAFTDDDKEATREYVSIINNCSQQLLTIIDDIIDISKIEAGQMTITPEMTHLNRLMHELYAYYRATGKDEITLEMTNTLPDEDCQIFTDPGRLRQILNNLLNNAMKFTEAGSIAFGYRDNNGMIEFFVSDTGIGIPKSQLKRIFKRFRQSDQKNRTHHGGTGLGLAICKALVKLLGGTIEVQSQLGKGSTFKFAIPREHNRQLG